MIQTGDDAKRKTSHHFRNKKYHARFPDLEIRVEEYAYTLLVCIVFFPLLQIVRSIIANIFHFISYRIVM